MQAQPIDWSRPWLRPYRAVGHEVMRHASHGAPVHAALQAARHLAGHADNVDGAGLPHFAAQGVLPVRTAYESQVFATGTVLLQDNLHDLFNGLVWLHYPATKRRLNALQARAIAASAPGAPRGALRDAMTVFDENGALLLAPDVVWDALRARDWRGLFVTHRAAWSQARLLLFGHGLMEKLLHPRKAITAHVYPAPSALVSIADIDHWLASAVGGPDWMSKPFTPLPVLGVPGWNAGHVDDCFYDDPLVFRPAARPDHPQQRTQANTA